MGYSNGRETAYTFETLDFGAGSENYGIVGPKGKAGRLIDYGVQGSTEAFAGGVLATIAVGTAANPDAFGEELSIVCADASGFTARSSAADVDALELIIVDAEIPADTVVQVTCTVASGGAEAGKAHPHVIIHWDD